MQHVGRKLRFSVVLPSSLHRLMRDSCLTKTECLPHTHECLLVAMPQQVRPAPYLSYLNIPS